MSGVVPSLMFVRISAEKAATVYVYVESRTRRLDQATIVGCVERGVDSRWTARMADSLALIPRGPSGVTYENEPAAVVALLREHPLFANENAEAAVAAALLDAASAEATIRWDAR